ncbi:MAG: MBL fold metallo-hydrolase, partial [Bacteroidota bacterium]
MKITFLGTGTSQGVPIIACNCEVCRSIDPRDQRLRSSVLVETDNLTIIIDTGPDFRHQMLRENVQDLDAVLYTHGHRDHIAGLDDIRAFNFIKQKPMDVYAEKRVIRALQKEFSYIFAEKKYPGVPQVNIHTIDTETFSINGENIIPVRGMHYRLPVLGFRIGDFTYLTDVNYISEEEKEKIFGSKYIVLTGLRKQKHISHFTLDEAIHLIRELSPR